MENFLTNNSYKKVHQTKLEYKKINQNILSTFMPQIKAHIWHAFDDISLDRPWWLKGSIQILQEKIKGWVEVNSKKKGARKETCTRNV